MDEQDLIRRAAEGDLEAFERLVERKRERVFWIACHIVGDRELARDVTQEVFLRLYRVIRRFRSGGPFDAWLHRITTNLSIDLLRRERPHRDTAALEDVPEGAAASSPASAVGAGGRATDRSTPATRAARARDRITRVLRMFVRMVKCRSRRRPRSRWGSRPRPNRR